MACGRHGLDGVRVLQTMQKSFNSGKPISISAYFQSKRVFKFQCSPLLLLEREDAFKITEHKNAPGFRG